MVIDTLHHIFKINFILFKKKKINNLIKLKIIMEDETKIINHLMNSKRQSELES